MIEPTRSKYRHTQPGYTMIAALGAAITLVIGRMLSNDPEPRAIVALFILVACLLVFPSLTIEIREGFLIWKFGLGIIGKRVPLSDIIHTTAVRTTLLQGWGIHRTPGGWLYNVSGFQAVEFELKDGRRFRLGTDQPEALIHAVSVNIGQTAHG